MPHQFDSLPESAMPRVIEALKEAMDVSRTHSSDPRTQTAAVMFSKEGDAIFGSYNAAVAPSLVENVPARLVAPEKYFWIEHSERALIHAAAKMGLSTDKKVMGCSLFPCVDCARAIVGSGFAQLITTEPDFADVRWGEEFRRSMETLVAGGVIVTLIKKSDLTSESQPPTLSSPSNETPIPPKKMSGTI